MGLIKKPLVFFLVSCILFLNGANAQDTLYPKREFRGVWIATVDNIDWPKKHVTSADEQQRDLIRQLDAHQKAGINAIVFQIRPAADAFYAQGREPWSKWLTGRQGQAPNPVYDPLEFAVNEAHKRGMELHAWFNPYRATFNPTDLISEQHITKTKPQWFLTYGGNKLFNPGLPEVREYIVQVVLDVVDNYDIDGVHMDDYFYPYAIAGQKLNDAATFAKYPNGINNIADWRRHNVDMLIKMLNDSIHAHKPWVKFGISPFGFWKNKRQDVAGSETDGGDSYYELYADSRRWVKEGWVDYIAPQIYWPFGDKRAPFDKLLDWWSDNTFDRHLYIGQAAYRINEGRHYSNFKLSTQLPGQITYLRKNPRVQGSIYFSSSSLMDNLLGFTDSLTQNYYRYPALPPAMLWLDSVSPNPPRKLDARIRHKAVTLSWKTPAMAPDSEEVYGYVVYRFNEGEKVQTDNAKNIVHIQYDTATEFEDHAATPGKAYQYVVTALDRLKNESYPSNTVEVNLR